jgi:hypothetical protein
MRRTALVVLCLQMDSRAGGWSCERGFDVVMLALNMTLIGQKGYITAHCHPVPFAASTRGNISEYTYLILSVLDPIAMGDT